MYCLPKGIEHKMKSESTIEGEGRRNVRDDDQVIAERLDEVEWTIKSIIVSFP